MNIGMNITKDELVAALEKAMAESRAEAGAGQTVEELAMLLGISPVRVRGMLRQQIAAGAVTSGRGQRRNITGNSQPVPVYRWIRTKKGKN